MIIFVAAHDKNYGIGNNSRLPWPLMRADLDRVYKLVEGKKIVLGEKTYHDYKNIQNTLRSSDITVISKSVDRLDDAEVVNSLKIIIERSKHEELWVIGGGAIFQQLIPYTQKMYLTEIDGEFEADTFFPRYSKKEWAVVSRQHHDSDSENPFSYTFLELKRLA